VDDELEQCVPPGEPGSDPGQKPWLSGVVPILLMPFSETDDIDSDALEAEARFLFARGARYVGIGFGSEVQRLGIREAESIVAQISACDAVPRIIGNVECASTRPAIASVLEFQTAGAAAVMLRPACAPGLSQQALFELLSQVAVDGGLPTVVQDSPEVTGIDLTPETLARLLDEVPEIVAVKIESSRGTEKIGQVAALRVDCSGAILGGSGGRDFLRELARGADGTMPGPALFELFVAVQCAYREGNLSRAREITRWILPFLCLGASTLDAFVFVEKRCLNRRGVLRNERLRSPHASMDPCLAAEADDLFEELLCEESMAELLTGAGRG
jgi:4-hydroxy-tetrahydrodipicolinate synthase